MGGISSMRRGDARWQGMMTSDDKKKIRWACAFAKPGIKKKLRQNIILNRKGMQCEKKYDTIFHIRFIGHKTTKNEDIYL